MAQSDDHPIGKKPNILVVEDDPDQIRLLERWLADVAATISSSETYADALDAVRISQFDLIVADISLGQDDGIELIRETKQSQPNIKSIVITAHETFDHARRAINNDVNLFLSKPLSKDSLTKGIRELFGSVTQQRVLAIGAHPDDVEIGAGGSLAAHIHSGDAVTILTMTGGEAGGKVGDRRAESEAAAKLLGAKLCMKALEDTRIQVDRDTIGPISEVIQSYQPDIVYTHSIHDRHQDHRAVHQATLVAARQVKSIFCYQAPSTTIEFMPNRYINIDQTLDKKLELITAFQSQTVSRAYLASDFIRATARYWGRFADFSHVEPFEVHRSS